MSDERHRRPDGVDDATVEATGRLGEALECIERARGRLYDFHQLMGHADLLLGEAADALEEAGHAEHADALRRDIVGRNVVDGRWTFQLVEEFDDLYWGPARGAERAVRDALLDGRLHVWESEMKDRRRSAGRPGHERRPAAVHDPSVAAVDG